MTYLLKHNQKPSPFSFLKRLIPILILLILGFYLGGSEVFKKAIDSSLLPFVHAGDSFYKFADQIPEWFKSRNELLVKIEKLEEAQQNFNLGTADLTALFYENQRLQNELGLQPDAPYVRVAVIARPPQMPFDLLLVNEGSQGGVSVGDLALSSDRSLSGKVMEVSNKTAIVKVNSFTDNLLSGFVARTGESIELRGAGGGNLVAKTPIDFDMVVGDSVLVSFGADYVVAIVGAIEDDVSGGAKNALLSLPFNLNKIETLFILK